MHDINYMQVVKAVSLTVVQLCWNVLDICLLYKYIINTIHLVGEIGWVPLLYFRCVQNRRSMIIYHEIKMEWTDISNKQVML